MRVRFFSRCCAAWRGAAFGTMSLLGFAGLGLMASHAQAQQADFPPIQQVAATSAPQQSGLSPIEELERRLDQQAREIQQLQTQLNGGGTGGTPAMTAAYISGSGVGTPCCPTGPDGLPMCQPAPPAAPCCTEVTNDKTPLNAYWNNGLWFGSTNSDFLVHVGGRIQFDAFDAFDVNKSVENGHGGLPAADWEESQGFRRDRVRIEGTIYDSVDFVWEYDFAVGEKPTALAAGAGAATNNGSSVFTGTGITDANVTLKYIPYIGNASIGSFLVPFSFELATSDRWMDFIERSAAFDAFVPGQNFQNFTLGLRAFNWNEDKTLTYQASVSLNNFWNGAAGFDQGDAGMFTGRVTALPYYDDSTGGRYMLECGLSGCAEHCQSDPAAAGADATTLRARLATREYLSPLTPNVTTTGVIDGHEQYTEGAELVGQWGPVCFESEVYGCQVTDDNGAGGVGTTTLNFSGGYAQLMYMLTGENRNYNRERANFERVVPYEDWVRMPGEYGRACGHGAWQVGIRYSYVDLNDKKVYGGQENEFTAGLNWFLNPNLKLQWNYDATYRDNEVSSGNAASNGWINGFGTRLVFDF
jgi:phosphate-selective porin OprO and OprP